MLEEVRTLCVMADEFGFDCFSTTEHHFHSEGHETAGSYLAIRVRTRDIGREPACPAAEHKGTPR